MRRAASASATASRSRPNATGSIRIEYIHHEAMRQLGIVRNHDSAAARRDDLVAVEAEAADPAERAHVTAVVGRSDTFGGIFDDRDAVLGSDLEDRIEIGGMAVEVHDEDGLR